MIDGTICQATAGEWAEESQGLDVLDARLRRCGLFTVYPEVWGYPAQPRVGSELKELRIDRVLVPTKALMDKGWRNGIVGIEGKKSGHKLGAAVLQAMDYSRAVWQLPCGGIRVVADWILLWPCEKVIGDIEAVMVQNRIGRVWTSGNDSLTMSSGTNLVRVWGDQVDIGHPKGGSKSGSR